MEPKTLMEMLFELRGQLKVRTKNAELLEKIIERAREQEEERTDYLRNIGAL